MIELTRIDRAGFSQPDFIAHLEDIIQKLKSEKGYLCDSRTGEVQEFRSCFPVGDMHYYSFLKPCGKEITVEFRVKIYE